MRVISARSILKQKLRRPLSFSLNFFACRHLLARGLCTACARQNLLVATTQACIRVNNLRLTRETRAVVDATLTLKVDTRRAYEARGFCAYQ
jgi:hypothetical protein